MERLRSGWGSALPTGVVTFFMSDVEGSTAMWESHPGTMAEALVRHDELIAGIVEERGGHFVKSMGEVVVHTHSADKRQVPVDEEELAVRTFPARA